MTRHDDHDLAQELGRALASLPSPRAPRTLLPRVLAAVADAETLAGAGPVGKPWPPFARAAVAAFAAAVITGLYWLWVFPDPLLTILPEPVHDAGRRADVVASTATDLWRVGTLVWQAVVAPIVKGLFTITLALCAASAFLAAALGRLALGGAQQS